MSSPEKLIKSAKAGNLREVRKMLGRNVQITKDKVGCKGSYCILCACWNKFVRPIYVYLAHNHVQEKTCYMSTKILLLLVWEYCTPWSCVEWPQWYRQSTSPCILLCGQHQQLWVHSPALGQSKWPRQSCENSAQMASRSVTAESGVQIRACIDTSYWGVLHYFFLSMVKLLFTWLPSTTILQLYLCWPLSKSIWMFGEW